MCSGSAEFFADILLCPWETVKLKVQTVEVNNWLEGKGNGYANGLIDGTKRLIGEVTAFSFSSFQKCFSG